MKKNLQVYYNYQISEDNKVIKKSRRRKSHSYVIGSIKAFAGFLGNVIAYTPIDTGGTSRSGYNSLGTYDAGSTNANYGIFIGSGTTAESINDYKLATKIGHGTTAGTMFYNACTVSAASATATDVTFRVTRTFTNQSGGTITVKEIGLVSQNTSTGYYFLHLRDLTGDIAVLNGQTLTLNYDFTTTL